MIKMKKQKLILRVNEMLYNWKRFSKPVNFQQQDGLAVQITSNLVQRSSNSMSQSTFLESELIPVPDTGLFMLTKPVNTNLLHVTDVAVCKMTTRCQTGTGENPQMAAQHRKLTVAFIVLMSL